MTNKESDYTVIAHRNPDQTLVEVRIIDNAQMRGLMRNLIGRVTIGNDCRFGKGISIYHAAVIGNSCTLEDNVNLQEVILGNMVTVGECSSIREGCKLTHEETVPPGITLPGGATAFMHLGIDPRGYAVCMGLTADGELRFAVGCRDYRLEDALKHWSRKLIMRWVFRDEEEDSVDELIGAKWILAAIEAGMKQARAVWGERAKIPSEFLTLRYEVHEVRSNDYEIAYAAFDQYGVRAEMEPNEDHAAVLYYCNTLNGVPNSPIDAKLLVIKLTPGEIQSGLDRVRWAENLIRQLPETHDGRNSWLINYGSKPVEPADAIEDVPPPTPKKRGKKAP